MNISAKIGVFLALVFFADSVFAQNSSKNFADGELLVKYKTGVNSLAAVDANSRLGAKVVENFAELKWQRVKLPSNLSLGEAIGQYQSFAEVETVQPNFYYHLLNTPNDPQFTSAGMYGLSKIAAPAAWDLTTGSSTVVVADIDTGLQYAHEDLAANAWKNSGEIPNNGVDDDGNGFIDDYYGYDFFYNDPDPLDENGHGTHTAGTIGAVGNNALGVVGVNWNVKIMAIKIYSPAGTDTTSAMLVNAYNYVRMMKNRGVNIRVTNNSYGGCNEACGYDQATKDALDAMGNAGILNVFAAGNAGQNIESTPFYPASYTSPSILSVASSTSTDTRSGFSNYGAVSVDLAAPGSSILSTFNNAGKYATLSGTSMATPHVAGAAALLAAYNPNLSVESLKATLMNSVDVLSAWNGIVKTGGRLNVAQALQHQTVCVYTFSTNSINAPTKGGFFSINVSAPANCETSGAGFTASSQAKWISLSAANFSGANNTIQFRVGVNQTVSRTGTITIGGRTLTVRQTRGN